MKRKIGLSGLVAIVMALFFGCAAQESNLDVPYTDTVYTPKAPAGVDSIEAAKADLDALLQQRRPFRIEFGERFHAQQGPKGFLYPDAWKELNRQENNNLYELTYNNFATRNLSALTLRRLPATEEGFLLYPSTIIPYEGFYDSPLSVKISGDGEYPYVLGVPGWILFEFSGRDLAVAQKLADDLYVMQQCAKQEMERRLALFEPLAAKYRELAVKTPVSEEQRRLIVQANSLNKRRDYAGAIDLYLKAIDLDPVAYPPAYFNLALLSAQMGRYRPAVSYMKQYLLLAPDAKDARSAQDKIYEWEIMIQPNR